MRAPTTYSHQVRSNVKTTETKNSYQQQKQHNNIPGTRYTPGTRYENDFFFFFLPCFPTGEPLINVSTRCTWYTSSRCSFVSHVYQLPGTTGREGVIIKIFCKELRMRAGCYTHTARNPLHSGASRKQILTNTSSFNIFPLGKRQKSVYRIVTAPQGGTQKYTLAFANDSSRRLVK